MALARLDLPGLVLYGGSIAPGRYRGRDVTIQDVFEAVGAHAAGNDDRRRGARARERRLPGRGRVRRPVHGEHDGDGARLPRHQPARARTTSRRPIPASRRQRSRRASSRCSSCASDIRPSQIMTREAFENAIAAIAASGGSTNGVLHLLAIARELGIELTIDEFDRSPRARRSSPTSSRAAATSPPICTRPAASRSSRASCLQAPALVHGDARTSTAARSREVATAVVETPGPGRRRPDRDAAQGDGRPRDPARQPRARGLRREARRPRAAVPSRARRACSTRRRMLRRREGAHDRRRATSS